MTRKTEALLWVDIETTGTDPRHDLMLEIGLRCTSMDAKTEYARYESIIKPDVLPTDRSFAYAHRMHEANWLIDEVIDASPDCAPRRVWRSPSSISPSRWRKRMCCIRRART